MMRMNKLLKGVLKLAGGVFALTLAVGIGVQAKEVTVSTAADFLKEVEAAKDLTEELTVTIASGSDITVERYIRVYSNTTINAEGATIRNTNPDYPLLVTESRTKQENITINGGTWETGRNAFMDISGATNVTVNGVVIHGGGGHAVRVWDSQNVAFVKCEISGASVLINGGSDNSVKSCKLDGSADQNTPSLQIQSSNAWVEGNTIMNSASNGIRIDGNVQNVRIITNYIENSRSIGIESVDGGNHKINDNTVKNSGFIGIRIAEDENSEICENKLLGNAVNAESNGEGLVVDRSSKGTLVSGNIIRDTQGRVDNVGNGIIVNRSENITVSGNEVSSSHNHGIQVSYKSKNVLVTDNIVSGSGRMGISVSRGAQADLKRNQISDSAYAGIVFDGKAFRDDNGAETGGTVSGSIENCVVSNSRVEGIRIESSHASMNRNQIRNTGGTGLIVDGSTVTLEDSKIFQDVQDDAHGGIAVMSGSNLTMNNNIISNFGFYGISGERGTTVNGKGNQVNISGRTFGYPAYSLNDAGGDIPMNTLTVTEIGRTRAAAAGNYADSGSGAVIGGAKRAGVVNGGAFSVEYPDTDPADVILYTQDALGNVICVQAPVNYSLKDAGNTEPDDNPLDDEKRKKVEEFVKRLYRVALGREADESGLSDWTGWLMSGEKKGAEVAWGFVFSKEMKEKKLNDEQFIRTLYSAMFGREADQGGLDGWLKDLQKGASREYVYRGFAESEEFENLCGDFGIQRGGVTLGQPRDQNIMLTEFVTRVYYIALNRDYLDEDGINNWCGNILNGGKPADAVWGIVFSDEFKNRNLDDNQFVNILYKTYFDRDADAEGYNNWFGKLQNGESRETVVNGFSNSEEFANLVREFGLQK